MNEHAISLALSYLEVQRLDGALISDPAVVTWLTGYVIPALHGPNPFDSGALLWLNAHSGHLILLVSDAEQTAAEATGVEVRVYPGYQITEPLSPLREMLSAFEALLTHFTTIHRIGLEALPAPFERILRKALPEADILELNGWTSKLRIIKTEAEITKLRAACALSSQAQHTLADLSLFGMTELEVFNRLLTAMEARARTRLIVLGDCVAGQRTSAVGGIPGAYTIQENDPVLVDIVPRLDGYWGDICNVRFAGRPSPELRKMYIAARDALHRTIAAVRPGVEARTLDGIARGALERDGWPAYPHHTGHGLGTTNHEEPRITTYNTLPLQAGMVIALEPGIYIDGVGGVRLEHVLLVTNDGAEILTEHSMEIEAWGN